MSRRVFLKPIEKLTEEQLKSLLARIFAKNKVITKSVAEKALQVEPPVTEYFSTLAETVPVEATGETTQVIRRMPYAEALQAIAREPERFAPVPAGQPVKWLRTTSEAPSAAEIAPGIAYSRVQEIPIRRALERYTQPVAKTYEQMGYEQEARLRGIEPELVRPDVKLQNVIEQVSGTKPKVAGPPREETAARVAAEAATLWSIIGGTRTAAGQYWKQLWQSSRLRPHFHSPRDYFVSTYTRYVEQPDKLQKAFPREYNLIKQLLESEASKDFQKATEETLNKLSRYGVEE